MMSPARMTITATIVSKWCARTRPGCPEVFVLHLTCWRISGTMEPCPQCQSNLARPRSIYYCKYVWVQPGVNMYSCEYWERNLFILNTVVCIYMLIIVDTYLIKWRILKLYQNSWNRVTWTSIHRKSSHVSKERMINKYMMVQFV